MFNRLHAQWLEKYTQAKPPRGSPYLDIRIRDVTDFVGRTGKQVTCLQAKDNSFGVLFSEWLGWP